MSIFYHMFDHSALQRTVLVALLVNVQSVVLEATDGGRVGPPCLPHEPPQLLPALPDLAGHVLRHVDVASLQQSGLPQHLVPVLELLKSDNYRSTASYIWT